MLLLNAVDNSVETGVVSLFHVSFHGSSHGQVCTNGLMARMTWRAAATTLKDALLQVDQVTFNTLLDACADASRWSQAAGAAAAMSRPDRAESLAGDGEKSLVVLVISHH